MSSPQNQTQAQDFTNQNGKTISASLTLLILPTVFVALRMVSRRMSRAGLWWDDWTVILGMILSWGPHIINLLASRRSLGHHYTDRSIVVSLFRDFYAFEVLYSLSISFIKFSVILFQYRIFPVPSFRRIIRICGILVVAFETASTIVFIFQCTPIRDFWISIGAVDPEYSGRCIKVVSFYLVNGSINTVTDFGLLLLPLPMIWNLRASTLQRSILTGIFITGLMVTAVSMVRLIVIERYNHSSPTLDPTYDFVPTCIWSAAEPSIAIVSACLPTLRPLIVRMIWGGASKSSSEKGQYLLSFNNTTSSWRGGSKVHDGSFSRLTESGKGTWANDVAVCAGRRLHGTEEEVLELSSPVEETPTNRIRAKTTVTLTVSQRVDWRDDLF